MRIILKISQNMVNKNKQTKPKKLVLNTFS